MMPEAEVKQAIALVILAAGAGKRMQGPVPKQLLPTRDGMPLLQKTINAARTCVERLASRGRPAVVLVVLGANNEAITLRCDFEGCHVLVNEDWARGMSSSIGLAIRELQGSQPNIAGVLLIVADQASVSASVLEAPIARFEKSGAVLVASSFKPQGNEVKIPGPPAFFGRQFFDELLQLEGDAGARKVVLAHGDELETVDFPEGGVDIDTAADYKSYLSAGS